LPVSRSEEDQEKRLNMFRGFDSSGNGQLSLAEIETGILSYMGDELYLMKPALKMAYKAARGVDPTDEGMESSYVDFKEFRIMLVNVRRYIQLFAAFDEIDGEKRGKGDGRIDFKEFKKGLDHMKEWGVTVEDPKAEFNAIDENDGGYVLFGEFCAWGMEKGLNYDSDFETGDDKAVRMEISEEAKANAAEEEYKVHDPSEEKKKARKRDEIDFGKYQEMLPVGKDEESSKQRLEMFQGIDNSGNGRLSLAEIDLGMLNYTGDELFLMKPAIKMAYKVARGADVTDNELDASYVEFDEFRVLLVNIRRYIQLYAAFDEIDDGDDGRINFEEFSSGLDLLKEWGAEVAYPKAEFDLIDSNDGGQVLFNEFCAWAMKKGLNYDSDFEDGDDKMVDEIASEEKEEKKNEESEQRILRKRDEIDFKKFSSSLPVGKDEASSEKRKEMFESMDLSGNGQLSLAEIDLGILNFVGEECFIMKPAIKAAYRTSRGSIPTDDEMKDSYVEKKEFRTLLLNVRRYIELYAAFDAIDDGDDGRINFEEFSTSLKMLEEWGVTVENPKEEFDTIDSNDGGQILFNEFCQWAMKKGLDYDSDFES